MNTLFYILFGICAFLTGIIVRFLGSFRGSSKAVYEFMTGFNLFAMVSLLVLIISMFWVVSWWVPVLMLIVGWFIFGSPILPIRNGLVALIILIINIFLIFVLLTMRFPSLHL